MLRLDGNKTFAAFLLPKDNYILLGPDKNEFLVGFGSTALKAILELEDVLFREYHREDEYEYPDVDPIDNNTD